MKVFYRFDLKKKKKKEKGKGALYDRRKGHFTSILLFVLQKKIRFFEEKNSAVLRKCYCHLILSLNLEIVVNALNEGEGKNKH